MKHVIANVPPDPMGPGLHPPAGHVARARAGRNPPDPLPRPAVLQVWARSHVDRVARVPEGGAFRLLQTSYIDPVSRVGRVEGV